MGFFRRRRPTPRARFSISLPDPGEQIVMLRPMIGRLTEVVTNLAGEVGTLRGDLMLLRPAAVHGTAPDLRPAAVAPAARVGDVVGEAVELQKVFDILNEQADALWFEKQWLQAEFAVAWQGVHLPGHPGIS